MDPAHKHAKILAKVELGAKPVANLKIKSTHEAVMSKLVQVRSCDFSKKLKDKINSRFKSWKSAQAQALGLALSLVVAERRLAKTFAQVELYVCGAVMSKHVQVS